MLSDIRINGSASEAVIDIEGVIGVPEQTQFLEPGGRVATYARFAEALAAVAAVQAPRVVVNIRSAGGDVNDALLIFDALQGLGAEVVTRCYGYVASAATVIAQAASPGCREISSNAFYLIHCSESAAEGNSRSLSAAKELLDRTDERIADIYASRSGRPVAGFAALMNENGGKGRWLTPGETVEAGLADTVIPSPVNCASGEMPDGCGDIGTLCRLFGLTPPPDVTGRERCSGLTERVVRRMGGAVEAFQAFSVGAGEESGGPFCGRQNGWGDGCRRRSLRCPGRTGRTAAFGCRVASLVGNGAGGGASYAYESGGRPCYGGVPSHAERGGVSPGCHEHAGTELTVRSIGRSGVVRPPSGGRRYRQRTGYGRGGSGPALKRAVYCKLLNSIGRQ